MAELRASAAPSMDSGPQRTQVSHEYSLLRNDQQDTCARLVNGRQTPPLGWQGSGRSRIIRGSKEGENRVASLLTLAPLIPTPQSQTRC